MPSTWWRPESIRERIKHSTLILLASVVITPTLSEVSTTPAISSLMRITPFGHVFRAATKRC
ncbi:Uncharacterised protein [Vibrio cholerae]|nr:Uncharacterised protein [Vibrio cholerae]CSI02819.1 Uncharacterised protein [Vibrio cholerae]